MSTTLEYIRSLALGSTLCALLALAPPISVLGQSTSEDLTTRGLHKSLKGDLDGAMADFNRAIELDPKNFDAYFGRGLVKDDKKDFDGAIADFSRAIELNPKDDYWRLARAYDARGKAKRAKGDLDGASADHNRAIQLDPTLKH